jgi:hypothetical protein
MSIDPADAVLADSLRAEIRRSEERTAKLRGALAALLGELVSNPPVAQEPDVPAHRSTATTPRDGRGVSGSIRSRVRSVLERHEGTPMTLDEITASTREKNREAVRNAANILSRDGKSGISRVGHGAYVFKTSVARSASGPKTASRGGRPPTAKSAALSKFILDTVAGKDSVPIESIVDRAMKAGLGPTRAAIVEHIRRMVRSEKLVRDESGDSPAVTLPPSEATPV